MKKRTKISLAVVAGIVLVCLILVRAYLPSYLRNYINKELEHLGDYRGHISAIDLHLWRGAATIHKLVVEKKDQQVFVPLVSLPHAHFHIMWRPLLRLQVRGSLSLIEPVINLVDAKDRKHQQSGAYNQNAVAKTPRGKSIADKPYLGGWKERLGELMPIQIDEFRIVNGTMHFRNFEANPNVDLHMEKLDLLATNLSNSRGLEDRLISDLKIKARVMGQAKFHSVIKLNALAEPPLFDLNAKISNLNLKTLNNFTHYYGNFDFNRGHGDFVAEIASRKDRVKGYIKPLLHEVDIYDWKQDAKQDQDGFLDQVWEAIAGASTSTVKNQRRDQFASVIPIDGKLTAANTNVYSVMASTFKNGFVRALLPKYENTISIDSVSH